MTNTLTIDRSGALHQRIDGRNRSQYFISSDVMRFVDVDAMQAAGWVVTDYRADTHTVIADMMRPDMDEPAEVEAAMAAIVWHGVPQTR